MKTALHNIRSFFLAVKIAPEMCAQNFLSLRIAPYLACYIRSKFSCCQNCTIFGIFELLSVRITPFLDVLRCDRRPKRYVTLKDEPDPAFICTACWSPPSSVSSTLEHHPFQCAVIFSPRNYRCPLLSLWHHFTPFYCTYPMHVQQMYIYALSHVQPMRL